MQCERLGLLSLCRLPMSQSSKDCHLHFPISSYLPLLPAASGPKCRQLHPQRLTRHNHGSHTLVGQLIQA